MYLLDTHALIWFLEGNNQLPNSLQNTLRNPSNQIFASIINFWEMAIKIQLKKLNLPNSLAEIHKKTQEIDIETLPLKFKHIEQLEVLPLHHRDPFDRILISQAKSESLTIISRDSAFENYEINCAWD